MSSSPLVVEILRVSRQLLLGEQLGVGAHLGIPQAALLAHVVDGGHRRRNGVMLPVLGLANHQHMFHANLFGARRGRQRVAGGLGLNAIALAEESKANQNG
jgi:hypothetical protein